MNSYDKTCEWLFSQLPVYQRQGRAAYKADLHNTEKLDEYFGNPHRNFQSIHIGGTNGKGSVSHMIASVLQVAGYRVGLYTSPHLLDFRERIRINGEMIPKREVVQWVSRHKAMIDELKPSFFELTVAMALDYFSRSQIDIAVIEVGMGGRLDSTNIITPLISIITNISPDHMEFLGDSLEKIAIEKAGIIKKRVPVLTGEERKEIYSIFDDAARKSNSPIYQAGKIFQVPFSVIADDGYQYFNLRHRRKPVYPGLKSDITSISQRKNLPVVMQAIEIIRKNRFQISEDHLYRGIADAAKNTGFHGRWEIIGKSPMIVLDTAHNQEGIKELVRQISETRHEKLHIIFGVVNDKAIDHMLRLLPADAGYYFTKADIPRALDEKILGAKAAFYGLNGKIFNSVRDAFDRALTEASDKDLILVTGSTFLVADAMKVNP